MELLERKHAMRSHKNAVVPQLGAQSTLRKFCSSSGLRNLFTTRNAP
jgi:hypothetical protein